MAGEYKITPKQEAFARAYVETSNASEAYRRCYDVSPDTKPEVIWGKACELLKNGKVAVKVLQLKEEHAKRHSITVDSLTEMLKEDRQLAHTEGEPNAAVNAVLAMAKLHGLVVEKKNVTSDNRHTHSAEPLSPFADFLAGAVGAGTEGTSKGPVQN